MNDKNKKKIKKGDYKYRILALLNWKISDEYLKKGGNLNIIENRIRDELSAKLGYSADWCRKRFTLRKKDRGALNSDQLIIISKYLNCSVDCLLVYKRVEEVV